MPTPTGVVWDADPHTLAKHRLLQAYLAAWLPTLLHGGYDGVTYAEGFAGPASTVATRPGRQSSPYGRSLASQRNLLADGRSVSIVLVEEDCRRIAELKRQMTGALTEAPVAPGASASSTRAATTRRCCYLPWSAPARCGARYSRS